jgi:hypothetical protein
MFERDQYSTLYSAEKVKYLIPGNRGQMLSGSHTLFEITRLFPETGMFEIRLLEGEDKDTCWKLPYEDVRSYEFFEGNKVLSIADSLEMVRIIFKFTQKLAIPHNDLARVKTLQKIANEQTKCKQWLTMKNVDQFNPDSYIASKVGSVSFMDLLREYLNTENLQALDDSFSRAYVHNPHSGEIVKGHAIVLAELGLIDYHGTVVRDSKLFSGIWSKSYRAKHIIKRIAFVRELWALSGLSSVSLYRAYGHDEALVRHQPSFLSTTFSFNVAEDIFNSTTGRVAGMFRQEVPLERLFMTFLETPAMNRQHQEAEAIILADYNNLAF